MRNRVSHTIGQGYNDCKPPVAQNPQDTEKEAKALQPRKEGK